MRVKGLHSFCSPHVFGSDVRLEFDRLTFRFTVTTPGNFHWNKFNSGLDSKIWKMSVLRICCLTSFVANVHTLVGSPEFLH